MPDDHLIPNVPHWGIKPILFQIGGFSVTSYAFFVTLGLVVGIGLYIYESRRGRKRVGENGIYIAIGALLGGAIGAKVFEFIINYNFVLANINNPSVLLSGRTITGGLIGGAIGAILTKKYFGIKEKRGNLFAPAIALGVAIGRLGCFFTGCCYGKPTGVSWWGVDFGDYILRHPTQIYEALFMLGMFIYLEKIKDRPDIKPGKLFKMLMVSYFSFRFLIEFIRVEPVVFAGLTVFQLISLVVIVYLTRENIKKFLKRMVGKIYASKIYY